MPSTWDPTLCQSGRRIDPAAQTAKLLRVNADVDVVQPDPLFQDEPWTLQHEDCGISGHKIQVPFDFFEFHSGIKEGKLERKSSLLLNSWFKYRYGVFSEFGFDGDKIFPAEYFSANSTAKNVGCNSKDSGICRIGDLYNREAPTKQNVLCYGASAMETVLSHKDFKTAWKRFSSSEEIDDVRPIGYLNGAPPIQPERDQRPFKRPRFSYFHPRMSPSTTYILLLDRGPQMSAGNRWRNLHQSLRNFIFSLPDDGNSEVGVITFDQNGAQMNLPPTFVTKSNRQGLYGRIPRLSSRNSRNSGEKASASCLECAFNTSYTALESGNGKLQSAVLILVSGSPHQDPSFSLLTRVFINAQVPIFTVSYPATTFADFSGLSLYGRNFAVVDESNDLRTRSSLASVFSEVVADVEPTRSLQRFFQAEFYSKELSGSFVVEESLRRNLRISLLVRDENEVEYFEIRGPSGDAHIFPTFSNG